MNTLHIHTPLLESRPLTELLGAPVILKMEALQPTGSFKIRGIGKACLMSAREGAVRFISSSGGNAGLAVAYAGRKLGIPVTVFVPGSTSYWMRRLIEREEAQVIEFGTTWDDAHARALETADRERAAYIHPFEDSRIWSGHATLVEEVAVIGYKPGAVVLSVGGGGLLCGVLEGLHRVGWTDVTVIAVETKGADSFAQSVAEGHLVTLERIESIATTLGARTVAARALDWTYRHPVRTLVVSDRAALEACNRFLTDHRILVEPACGAALSAVYQKAPVLKGVKDILVVVCGGAGVNLDLLHQWDRDTDV